MVDMRMLIVSYTKQATPNVCTKFRNPRCSSSWEIFDTNFPMKYIGVKIEKRKKWNKRTMMVLYRSPEQTALYTYYYLLTIEVSAMFTALRFLYKFYYCPAPQWPCFFQASRWFELNLGRGSPKEQFCKDILKSVQWFLTKRFLKCLYSYIGKIGPTP